MIAKILAGVAVTLGLALAGTGYWLSNVIESRAAVRASLDTAVKANATNQATISRLEGDAVIAQAIAIADAQAREKAEGQRDELVNAARNAPPCGGLDAILDARRRQLEGQPK